ncbi:MAG: prolipoprotein diacylglyceryl transferase [Deltaproteobacteria bacterium]|nr:prolipoprotein diacylglyceryl transferase [Deltaproteobacteria bacterium]
MYPVLWEPFGFAISSFGVMVAIGFLVSDYVVARRFREMKLDPELSSTILIYAVVFGVLGSKLYYAIEFTLRGEAEFFPALLSRAGMVWFGGLILGTIGVTVGTWLHKIPTASVAAAVANAAPFGQACGRIGCFLVGDDYGKPTDAWYGIAFPEGAPPTVVPVHPTQLYETAWLIFIGIVLWRRRKASPFLFAEYGVLAGVGRFAVETLRVNPPMAFGLTGAQLIGITMVVVGGAAWLYARQRAHASPDN